MLRKAWGTLLFFVVAVIAVQVAAATIEPYVPTILSTLTILFFIVVAIWLAVFIWKLLRNRRRLL